MSNLPGEGTGVNKEVQDPVDVLIEYICANEVAVDASMTEELIALDQKKLSRTIVATASTEHLNSVASNAGSRLGTLWEGVGVESDRPLFTPQESLFTKEGGIAISNKLGAIQKLCVPFIRDALILGETTADGGNDCRRKLGHEPQDVIDMGLKAIELYCTAQRGKALLNGNYENGESAIVDELRRQLMYQITGEAPIEDRTRAAHQAIMDHAAKVAVSAT